MKGKLSPDRAAHVEIKLVESDNTHDVILDTGFSDFLYLPEDLIAACDLGFIGSVPMTLADKRIMIADVFEANLVWFGVSQQVTVTAGPFGCDSLLGMRLLEGCRIELDNVNGGGALGEA
jgi:clan AA aspartic protease